MMGGPLREDGEPCTKRELDAFLDAGDDYARDCFVEGACYFRKAAPGRYVAFEYNDGRCFIGRGGDMNLAGIALSVLRNLEWAGTIADLGFACCPECSAEASYDAFGLVPARHEVDCDLKRVLDANPCPHASIAPGPGGMLDHDRCQRCGYRVHKSGLAGWIVVQP